MKVTSLVASIPFFLLSLLSTLMATQIPPLVATPNSSTQSAA